jgi:hypothetical protein
MVAIPGNNSPLARRTQSILRTLSTTTVPCTSIGQICTKHPASKLPPLVSLSSPQESTVGCAPLLASTTGHASPWWYPWGMRRKRWGDHDAEAWVVARILGKVKMVEIRLCKTTDFLTNIGKLELFRCYHPSFFLCVVLKFWWHYGTSYQIYEALSLKNAWRER